jgi:hypothetical protein
MILELIVNVLFTQDAPEGIALICRQCRIRERVRLNDGKGCSTIGADRFSHFSILTWQGFANSNCLALAHLTRLFPSSGRTAPQGQKINHILPQSELRRLKGPWRPSAHSAWPMPFVR